MSSRSRSVVARAIASSDAWFATSVVRSRCAMSRRA
jgi:hypothetical protein